MKQDDMVALVERHLKAEGAGDVDGAVSVYTEDIEHDVVGWPGSPLYGKSGARGFYEHLTANFRTEDEQPTHRYFTDDAMVLDQVMTGTVIGQFLGLPGNGRRTASASFTSSSSVTGSSPGRTFGWMARPSRRSSPPDGCNSLTSHRSSPAARTQPGAA